jgi:hypothetical protein
MLNPILLMCGVVTLGVSPVNCVGTAFIENWCDVEVYVWSVADVTNNTMNPLAPTVGDYNETYRTNPNGGGISLKIATAPVDSYITQFEYTYHADNPSIYYDVSNVNGYPFEAWGLALSPSEPNCSSISCDPGVPLCPQVFNKPNDTFAIKGCDISTNLTLTLCPPQTTIITMTETVTATIVTTDLAGDPSLATEINPIVPNTTLVRIPFHPSTYRRMG